MTSCKSKYSADKYVIPKSYRDLISSFIVGDTLKFVNNKGHLSSYLLAAIDSSFVDEGKGFINARGRKDIVITCREIANPRRGYEEYHMIILNKYPDEDSATFDLRLKDFYYIDTTKPFVQKSDTLLANGLAFTDYYVFYSGNYAEQKDSNSVIEIYMTKQKGIVAYKSLNGTWWTNIK